MVIRTCRWCGQEFSVPGRRLKAWKSCPACRTQTATTEQRFWRRVIKSPDNDCWDWAGSKSAQGYGWFWNGSGMTRASRVSWQIHYGDIPTGMCICHHCDNPVCANPHHLYLGTYSDNVADAYRRGRNKPRPGTSNSNAKLTEGLVRTLREAKKAGVRGRALLALCPEVNKGAVYQAINRKTWAHVP